RETGHTAGLTAQQPAVARACAVVRQRMAREAAGIDRLAPEGIARRCECELRGAEPAEDGTQQQQLPVRASHTMKAEGTGACPSAWRSTAQCMASSPSMLAAALDRSRLSKTGTAPR